MDYGNDAGKVYDYILRHIDCFNDTALMSSHLANGTAASKWDNQGVPDTTKQSSWSHPVQ